MPEPDFRQSLIDQEHLKLLSLGFYVSAGTTAFFSLFALLYVAMGIFIASTVSHFPAPASNPAAGPPPAFVGYLFAGIGLVIFLFLLAIAALKFQAARCIQRRRARTFCMVVAGLSCLEFPYGTVLGVLAFIVLGRDSVELLFTYAAPPQFTT